MTDPEQQGVDPEAVISYLGRQIGVLSTQLAMRDVAREQDQRRIAELEDQARTQQQSADAPRPPAPPTRAAS